MKVAATLATLIYATSVALAVCSSGLKSTFWSATREASPVGERPYSVKKEYNPNKETECTNVPNSGKKCVSGSVEKQVKATLYDNRSCSDTGTTAGWKIDGTMKADSLCDCPT